MDHLSRRAFLGTAVAASSALAAGPLADPFRPRFGFPNPDNETAPFKPDTLFLTWQRDPCTTMTIQWVGVKGETADNTITYAPAVGGALQKITPTAAPYPKTDYKVFRAELKGLLPGFRYKFRIGRSSPLYQFRTMPAKATDAITFVSGGDCGVNAHAIANNIQAAKQSPQFCLIGGDLGYDNGRSVEVSLAFLRNYSKHMVTPTGDLIPMLTCIGNHEVLGSYNQKPEKATFYRPLFDGLYPDNHYATLDFGDYLSLVLLDTGHTAPIDGEQAAWLEKQLKARQDHPHVIGVNHVPCYPSYRNPKPVGKAKAGTGELQRKHWCPLFDKYRVPVVLEHHDHTFKKSKAMIDGLAHADGVRYLGDGSWGRLRTPNTPEKLAYLEKVSKDYHMTLHRIEGQERFHCAINEDGKVLDMTRTGQRKSGIIRVAG